MQNLNSILKLKKKKNKNIILIDGMNLFHRQYHIFSEYPTGTAFGMLNTIMKISNDVDSNRIIVCWDGKKNWRSDDNSDYKLTRKIQRKKQFSEDQKLNFAKSLEFSKKLLKSIGIIQVLNNKYEADDIIAYYVKLLKKYIIIVSNDKDFAQLVNDEFDIKIMKPDKKRSYIFLDEAGVKNIYGVSPNNISKFLAIAGDTSDNVKGVWRMGKVKAKKLINNNQVVKNNLKNIFNREQLAQFIESYRLVKLGNDIIHKIKIQKDDFIMADDLNEYKNKNYYNKKVQTVLEKFNIKKYRSFEVFLLFNYKFINEIMKIAE